MTEENIFEEEGRAKAIQELLAWKNSHEKEHEKIQSDMNICLSAANAAKEVESLLHRFKSIEDNVAALRIIINDHVDNHDVKRQRNFGADIPKPLEYEVYDREERAKGQYPPKWKNCDWPEWDEWCYLFDGGKYGCIDSWRPGLSKKLQDNHNQNNKNEKDKSKWKSIVDNGIEYRITGWFRSKDDGKWNAYVSRRKIAGIQQEIDAT